MTAKETQLLQAWLYSGAILIAPIYALSPWGDWNIGILFMTIFLSALAGVHWYQYMKTNDKEEALPDNSYLSSAIKQIKATPYYQMNQKKTSLLILCSGIVTSIIALFLVNYISSSQNGIYLMGYYLDIFIPIGALGVGFVAGSGYGIAAWVKGFKVNFFTLYLIICLQIIVYFIAKYLEFDNLNLSFDDETFKDFWHYYDSSVRSFAWEKDFGGRPGEPLGLIGYLVNILEILGFSFGAIIAPLILFLKPYCENCQIYMKTTNLCSIPAGVIPKIMRQKDLSGIKAYEMEQNNEWEKGNKKLLEIKDSITYNDSSKLNQIIQDLVPEKKNAAKLMKRINLDLVFCKVCCNGHLQPILLQGFKENLKKENLEIIKIPNTLIKKLLLNNYSYKRLISKK